MSDGWTDERVELVKRTICPKGISTDEFMLFIEQCKRSGLDPLLKEAFCVARRQNIGTRDKPNWVNKHEFQPSEAGMLARAERFPDYEGISAAEVFGEDPISVDYGAGTVEHRVNPAQRKGGLVGAWARVQRRSKVPVVVWVDFAAVVQQTPLWSKMPGTMVRKCARVAALRTAYPEAFGGLYVREEMPAEEFPEEPASQPAPAKARASIPAKTATREAVEVAESGMRAAPEPEVVEHYGERRASEPAAKASRLSPASEAKAQALASQLGGQVMPPEDVAAVIVAEAEVVETGEDFGRLAARAKALPKDSAGRKQAAAALQAAAKRLGITGSTSSRQPGEEG